jgi:hypothetical protein
MSIFERHVMAYFLFLKSAIYGYLTTSGVRHQNSGEDQTKGGRGDPDVWR